VVLILKQVIMKTTIMLVLILVSEITFAQDTINSQCPDRKEVFFWIKEKKQVFAITPMSKRIEEVNGLAFGFGHVDNKLVAKQTINGLNVEVNPAPIVGGFMAFMYLMYLPEIIQRNHHAKANGKPRKLEHSYIVKDFDTTTHLVINGLNISSGCFFTQTSMNGLNLSFGNKFKNFNGLSIAPLGTMADRQNGISVGLLNANNDLNGFVVGVYNQSFQLDGLQIGLVNQAVTNHGLQLGLFNRSHSKGFQIGIWNKNVKRSFPILNW